MSSYDDWKALEAQWCAASSAVGDAYDVLCAARKRGVADEISIALSVFRQRQDAEFEAAMCLKEAREQGRGWD